MKLSQLVADVPGARLVGDGDVEVRGVSADSRSVSDGDLFVAVRGRTVDGHKYVPAALNRGAVAVVVEHETDDDIPQVVVDSGAVALGHISAEFWGRPGQSLRLIGITGTNGKTTTTYLVESILLAAGRAPGVIGTVSYRYGGETHPAPFTTPTPQVLHETLRKMVGAGCTDAVLEVSSAALDMDRLASVSFDVAAFTNLSQDHLDVHATMEDYRAAKARLFSRHLKGTAVINRDDDSAPAMSIAAADRRVISASRSGDADVVVESFESTIRGIRAELRTPRGPLRVESAALLGEYNVENIATAVAIACALDIPSESIAEGIRRMDGVPGRVERVDNGAGLDILVDYAHTPDALVNLLAAVRPLAERRLICVFGCGGDRDPGKRPQMGSAVARSADIAIVTSDNPRTEDPRAIIDMILPAVPSPFFVDVDRRTAIRAAICEATPGDIVVIAGKGHEDYQILGTDKIHFDDREEAAEAAALRQSFPVAEIAGAAAATVVVGTGNEEFSRVVIDGRSAAAGDLYVAIEGERFDGHEFCGQAARAGAAGVLVATGRAAGLGLPDEVVVLEADDPRLALGHIARWHRRRWGKPVIGVTGSAGKTTTKELIAAALSGAGRVHRSRASLNNETGVPLTLLGLRPYHDFAVVEMGMRAEGEIAYLTDLAEPNVGVVVNAGVAHVGVVGSVEAIARGKSEIFAALDAGGAAVYPAADTRLAGFAKSAPRSITFGSRPEANVRIHSVAPAGAQGSELILKVDGRPLQFLLPLVGRHNADNAACAIAVAAALGVDAELAARGLESSRPPSMRSEVVEVAGRSVLVDCYNANPASMEAAIETLGQLRGTGSGVVVIGDMLELGDEAEQAHRAAGRQAAKAGLDVIAIGDHAASVAAGAREAGGNSRAVDTPEAAAEAVLSATCPGDWILVKASRKMRLERVVDAMRTNRS